LAPAFAPGLRDWNTAQSLRNTGPGTPPPNGLPSSVVMATTSFVEDDSHISSAASASARVIGRISTGIPAPRANSIAAS